MTGTACSPEVAAAERLANITRWAFHLDLPPVALQPAMLREAFLATRLAAGDFMRGHLPGLPLGRRAHLLRVLAGASDHLPAAAERYGQVVGTGPADLTAPGAVAALAATTG
jgi:hypothetical protein